MVNKFSPAILLTALLLATGCTPEDPVAKARELLAMNRPQQALEALQAPLRVRSEDPEVHFLYGIAMARIGQPHLGQWSLRKAMEDPEWLVPAGIEVVRAGILTGSHDAAIAAADRVLEAEPENVVALMLRSRARIDSRRDYEAALADADRALELDPDEPEAMIVRAVSLLALERSEEAAPLIDALSQRFAELDLGLEQEAHYCVLRAQFSVAEEDLDGAEERFEQCLALAPGNAQVIASVIAFYDEQDRPERSLEIMQAALEESPNSPDYRKAYAVKLHQAGRSEEARDLLMEGTLLEADGAAVEAWGALSEYYSGVGDYAAAASAVDGAVARMRERGHEPAPELVFHWADKLILAGRLDEALELVAGIPVPVYRHLVEGRVFLERGRNAEALSKFSEGLTLWPQNAVVRYYTAIAAERTGDIDRAIEEYRYAIRAGATETDARIRLSRLHSAEGEMARSDQAWGGGRGEVSLDARLEGVRVAARSGEANEIRKRSETFRNTSNWGRAVAAVAEGMGERHGPEAAARVVLGSPELDLTQPQNADALRVLVVSLAEMEKAEEILPTVDAAIQRSPNQPLFRALRGQVLEIEGAPTEAVRRAYRSALALDAGQVMALEGLARLALRAGNTDQALEFYARAAAADEEAETPVRAAVDLLLKLGQTEAAETQLEELVARAPYDPRGSLQLARLRIARGAEPDRTLVLARQAVRFRGGPEAEALLTQLEGTEPQSEAPGRSAVEEQPEEEAGP